MEAPLGNEGRVTVLVDIFPAVFVPLGESASLPGTLHLCLQFSLTRSESDFQKDPTSLEDTFAANLLAHYNN